MKKRIGVDVSPLCRKNYSGTEWYLWNLIISLKKLAAQDQFEWYLYAPKEKPKSLNLPLNWHWQTLKWPLKYFWLQARLSLEMVLNPPELLFVPANALPFIKAPLNLVNIHDLGFIKLTDAYSITERLIQLWSTRRALKVCPYVLTISEFTKNEIKKYYHLKGDNIMVAPLAIDKNFWQERELERIEVLPESYILFVGRICLKKNIIGLIKAFEKIASKNLDNIFLYLVGQDGFGKEKIDHKIARSPYKARIRVLPWQEEKKLLAIIKNATMLVLPSQYEGFGLPVLEAQALGVPIICSDIPALRETANQGALFFSLDKDGDLAEKILELLDKSLLKEALIKKGRENLSRFNFIKTTQITLETIEKCF